jgi:hypothetical protein
MEARRSTAVSCGRRPATGRPGPARRRPSDCRTRTPALQDPACLPAAPVPCSGRGAPHRPAGRGTARCRPRVCARARFAIPLRRQALHSRQRHAPPVVAAGLDPCRHAGDASAHQSELRARHRGVRAGAAGPSPRQARAPPGERGAALPAVAASAPVLRALRSGGWGPDGRGGRADPGPAPDSQHLRPLHPGPAGPALDRVLARRDARGGGRHRALGTDAAPRVAHTCRRGPHRAGRPRQGDRRRHPRSRTARGRHPVGTRGRARPA